MGVDDERATPNESPGKEEKGPDLKLRAMIIIASAIFSYAMLILGLEYQDTHDPEKWLVSSAYYDPALESLAVNYQDVQKHTAKATVHLQTIGDVLKLGEFFESQQAFIVRYAIDESTPSPPQSVTFTIQLNDGSITTKTIDVQVIKIIQNNGEITITGEDGKDLPA